MQENVDAFSRESPIAKRVRLAARVVIYRDRLSVRDVVGIRESGKYCPEAEAVCELEVGGQVLARGEIVEHEGHPTFRVREILDEDAGRQDDRPRGTSEQHGEVEPKEGD